MNYCLLGFRPQVPQTHNRGVGQDAQNRLAAVLTTGALMNLSDDCWTPASSFANVAEVAINR